MLPARSTLTWRLVLDPAHPKDDCPARSLRNRPAVFVSGFPQVLGTKAAGPYRGRFLRSRPSATNPGGFFLNEAGDKLVTPDEKEKREKAGNSCRRRENAVN